jgi:hypothetical protein
MPFRTCISPHGDLFRQDASRPATKEVGYNVEQYSGRRSAFDGMNFTKESPRLKSGDGFIYKARRVDAANARQPVG